MAKAPTPPNAPASYEAAVQELEQLVARMESGQLALDDMLGAYQRGAVLLSFCRERLTAVENQVQLLEGGEAKPGPAD
jgi:exodeoxyribonuclease VII small subunit